MKIKNEIEEMINQFKLFPVNKKIIKKEFQIYIRVTKRFIDGEMKNTIDIGSIDVKEKHQGKGIFREILKEIEDLAQKNKLTIFIECIHNEILIKMLERRNYIFIKEEFSFGAPNVYKNDFETPKKINKQKLR